MVYYRPTVGNCRCRHLYDGSANLLHNLDNSSTEASSSKRSHNARYTRVRSFLSEVARRTPVCGMIQIAGDRDAINIMKKVANEEIYLTNSRFFK
ncbi:Hypp710 [Branchiostoma lanceolatum]|uniref:Hypp710 protein n=1 Tax=Branchiostoma lanceolatum TaxID=7740 RepID=A0A8J9VCU1_BRALA|nr:Hypp710 [Branchiostoma lanceolatum]